MCKRDANDTNDTHDARGAADVRDSSFWRTSLPDGCWYCGDGHPTSECLDREATRDLLPMRAFDDEDVPRDLAPLLEPGRPARVRRRT